MTQTQTDWKSKLPFLEASKPFPVEIEGQDYNFYPISAGKIFKLKNLAKPIGAVLTSLQGSDRLYTGSKTSRFEGDSGGPGGETIEIDAIDPALEAQHAARKEKAISSLVDEITSEANISVVGEIIMDSMKDHFSRAGGRNGNPSGSEFIQSVPLPFLFKLITGVVEANKEVFGPLGGKIQKAVSSRLDLVAEDQAQEPEQEQEMSSQSEATLGSISPTQSSGLQAEATPSNGS